MLEDVLPLHALFAELQVMAASPNGIRAKVLGHIHEEIEHAKAARPAQIWMKMNALVDPQIIDTLYEASEAGVEIDLVVRGICCLRPGVPGLSERIRVRSIIGHFLEHARACWFSHGGADLVFCGSADWMERNLSFRIETIFPVFDPTLRKDIRAFLDIQLNDNLITVSPKGHEYIAWRGPLAQPPAQSPLTSPST